LPIPAVQINGKQQIRAAGFGHNRSLRAYLNRPQNGVGPLGRKLTTFVKLIVYAKPWGVGKSVVKSLSIYLISAPLWMGANCATEELQ